MRLEKGVFIAVFLLASIPYPLRAAEKEAPALTSNVDVLQAIASAGGPDEFAKPSRIKIFRREGGKTAIIPFDYGDVIAGKNLESNILLRRGDVVVIP